MPSVSLKAEHVGKRFARQGQREPGRLVLEKVSFSVNQGETFGIMGASGTGKTTLAKILAGLEPPSSGTVTYAGRSLSSLDRNAWTRFRRKVQLVFQNPEGSLNPRKSIGRSLQEALRLAGSQPGERRGRIAGTLNQVGLTDEVLERRPSQLSGGQNQRIVLARVLLLDPEFLILDEPASSLDISVRAQLLHLLKSLQERNRIGYVFISHDPDVLQFMTDHIGVIEECTLQMARKMGTVPI
jgi:peptide/nickel transport system ATP-binding protein